MGSPGFFFDVIPPKEIALSTPTLVTMKVKPRQCREFILDILHAKHVPLVVSSPGVGKSSIIKGVSKQLNLKVIDHRLSTSEPTDMTGLPNFDAHGRAYFAPFSEIFPVVGDPLPQDKTYDSVTGEETGVHTYDGWNLFLDELPSATKQVQAAAFKLILDKMVGQRKIHPRVVMTAAGNLLSDRSVVNPLVTAMQSRMVHLELEVDQEQWLADVAFKNNFDSRIIGFISQFAEKLMDFKPDHKDKTFACPRTWDMLNDQLRYYNHRGTNLNDDYTPLIAGYIGSPMALEFMQYIKVWTKLPKVLDIIADPLTITIPHESEIKWATVSMLMQKVDDKNFDAMTKYVNRFDTSFKLLFYRMCLVNKPDLRRHPSFGSAVRLVSEHLNPDWSITKSVMRP